MPAYLSDEWFAAVADVLGSDPIAADVTVEQRAGDVVWHLLLGRSDMRLLRGPAERPDITLTQSYETASAVARGQRSAQAAFMAGEITLGGDVSTLLAIAPALAEIEDRLADVRAETTY